MNGALWRCLDVDLNEDNCILYGMENGNSCKIAQFGHWCMSFVLLVIGTN